MILRAMFITVVAFFSTSVLAGPYLVGEMARLQVFDQPQKIINFSIQRHDNRTYYISDFKDKIILINLWATWCPPCIKELPSLDLLKKTFSSDDFDVVAVSMDSLPLHDVHQFLVDRGVENLETYIEHNGSVSKIRGLQGLPTSFLIDEEGYVVAKYEGDADWNSEEVKIVINYFIDKMKNKKKKKTLSNQ